MWVKFLSAFLFYFMPKLAIKKSKTYVAHSLTSELNITIFSKNPCFLAEKS